MSQPAGEGRFPTTHWTLIARIKSDDEAVAATAIEELCAQYHYPLYCYLRRRGCEHHDAQDVLHDFLVGIFRQRTLARLDEVKGRLRGYLATSIGRHLQGWKRSEARRTAPAAEFDAALDFEAIEDRYQHEQFDPNDTPDRVFERKWTLELLRQVMDKVGATYERRRKSALFAALRPVLESGGSLRGEDTPALAAQLGMSEGALRVAMNRLLDEFRDSLRAEVRLTVEHADEVPDELTYLLGLFRR
jgi:DNA-directed RNA polymerase specialized sigma24 family protein